MARVILNGVETHYQRWPANGPEIVLIHGLATSLAFWYFRILPMFGQDYGITTYDLRGHGLSGMPPSGYTTAAMASDLDALLTHLGIERAHFIGHSYGAAVVLHYAVLRPERVLTLTLADTRVRALQPTQRLDDWPQKEIFARILREASPNVPLDHPEMGHLLLELLAEAQLRGMPIKSAPPGMIVPFGHTGRPSQAARSWLRLLHTTTARGDITAVAGLTPDRIATVTQPVLAMFGEYSNCLPSCQGLQRWLPNCRVSIVPRAGHFHPAARPAYFGNVVKGFLEAPSTQAQLGSGEAR